MVVALVRDSDLRASVRKVNDLRASDPRANVRKGRADLVVLVDDRVVWAAE